MASGGDVQTSVGGVVVGDMMRLVAWCVHGDNESAIHIDIGSCMLM